MRAYDPIAHAKKSISCSNSSFKAARSGVNGVGNECTWPATPTSELLNYPHMRSLLSNDIFLLLKHVGQLLQVSNTYAAKENLNTPWNKIIVLMLGLWQNVDIAAPVVSEPQTKSHTNLHRDGMGVVPQIYFQPVVNDSNDWCRFSR